MLLGIEYLQFRMRLCVCNSMIQAVDESSSHSAIAPQSMASIL
jgi:hypothetical protein